MVPKAGRRPLYVAAEWAKRDGAAKIRAIRMRPDRGYPTYVENSETFKNTYLKPVHTGTGAGDIRPCLDFIAHLLPDGIRARMVSRLAGVQMGQADIPGIAVVMVAQDVEGQIFGTGRGMLRDILQRLLGNAYARHVDFDILTGQSAQGVYTDFLADVILLMVDEAKDTADASRWSERRAAYERLKSMIDPRAIERSFMVKGGQRFFGLCFAGFLIFTNNLDAIQIPAGDRRFGCSPMAGGCRGEWRRVAGVDGSAGQHRRAGAFLEARDISEIRSVRGAGDADQDGDAGVAGQGARRRFPDGRGLIGKNGLFTGEQFCHVNGGRGRVRHGASGRLQVRGQTTAAGGGHGDQKVPDAADV